MRIIARVSVLLALIAVAFSAVARPLAPEDMYKLRHVSDARISPNGNRIVYTVTIDDAELDESSSDLWLGPVDGGANVQLTHTPESEHSPRWSPDGRSIAFLSNRADTDASTQVWLLTLGDGEARQLTTTPHEISEIAWSPDGKRIAFVATVEPVSDDADEDQPKPIVIDRFFFKQDVTGYLGDERSHIFLLDVASGTVEQLTDGNYYEQQVAWSPDGKRIAFVSKRHDDFDRDENWDIYVTDAKPGTKIETLTRNPGTDGDPDFGWGSGPPAWSGDGRSIAYLHGGAPEDIWYGLVQVGVVGADGKNLVLPTGTLDRNTWRPRWAPDGRSLYFLFEDDQSVQLASVGLDGGPPALLTATERVVHEFDISATGVIALVMSSPTQPAEVWALHNDELRKITAQNDAWLADVDLLPASSIAFPSADGLEIHGMLINPKPGRKQPLVLRIHGGPVSQYQYEFDFEWQMFAAAGYAVAGINPRGSTGRGYEFQKSLFGRWGIADVPDMLAAVDFLVDEGVADERRLGVGGWSYGGMLTNYVIASSDRFKAAISGSGISNMLSGYGIDQYVREWELELGRPWENTETWLRLSYPFLQADRISTPTLFLCGSFDFNVPLVGSEQMYQALRSLGVPTQLVIYPEQYHSLTRPSFQLDKLRRYLAWYETYLK